MDATLFQRCNCYFSWINFINFLEVISCQKIQPFFKNSFKHSIKGYLCIEKIQNRIQLIKILTIDKIELFSFQVIKNKNNNAFHLFLLLCPWINIGYIFFLRSPSFINVPISLTSNTTLPKVTNRCINVTQRNPSVTECFQPKSNFGRILLNKLKKNLKFSVFSLLNTDFLISYGGDIRSPIIYSE
jgi:hypothetical protein